MSKNVWVKIFIAVVVCAISVYFFYPPKGADGKDKIKLGLDLKGGMHLELEVKTDKVVQTEVHQTAERVRQLLEGKITVDEIKSVDRQVQITGVSSQSESELKKILTEAHVIDSYDYSSLITSGMVKAELTIKADREKELIEKTIEATYETLQRRINAYGLEDNVMQQSSGGANMISLDLPGVETPEDVKELLKKTAQLEFKLVHDQMTNDQRPVPRSEEEILKLFNGRIPEGYEMLPYTERSSRQEQKSGAYLLVKSAPVISGKHLKEADAEESRSLDETGPGVSFRLTSEGATLFEDATSKNVGRCLAIVLDGQIISAPHIREKISESGRISGGMTDMKEAKVLATALKSGALPADIVILAEKTIGPSLGLKSIQEGVFAGLLGVLLITMFMLVYYKLSGFNAVLCLVVNVIILLGFMGGFHASLTLPGIAGIILTVGMGVDTNVLIFERIREELKLGKTVGASVDAGFNKAFITILDTHVTSIVSGCVLYYFGSVQIKGFAVTLIAGLVANLFSAVFVSRIMFGLTLQQRRVKKLSI